MSASYRVAWTSTWDHPKPMQSSVIPTLAEAERHCLYVARSPWVKNCRVQVREWADILEPAK